MSLTLTVLGCAATFPRPDNPSSGYLLRSADASVWVDCGSGTFAALQRQIDPRELTAVWVSHLHPDHCADLLSVFNWAANTPGVPRLPVYGPPGWAERLTSMLPSEDAAHLVQQAFEVHSLRDGHLAEVGDVVLRTRAVEHGVPAFGLRMTQDGHTISYSGDTGPCPALIDLAREADLFLCEVSAAMPQLAHCTVADAIGAAVEGRSHRLVLTHVGEGVDTATPLLGDPHRSLAAPGITITIDD